MRYKLIKYFFFFIIFWIALFLAFSLNGIVENSFVRSDINEFISRGVLIQSGATIRYYEVKKEHEHEDTSRHIFTSGRIGSTGDIVVTNRNPMRDIEILGPIAKLLWIGHSALVVTESGSEILEVVGNGSLDENVVQINNNNFGFIVMGEVVGLRVKNTTEEQRNVTVDKGYELLGLEYNFNFVVEHPSRYYCSDLVSRLWKKANVNINYDHWVTTGNDMIASPETYLIYYSYVDAQGIKHIYYLVD